jgi:hypothetical protein
VSARPSDYELFCAVNVALGALHPRTSEAPKAALRELLNRLNTAHDTYSDQSDRIEQLEKRCA